jgi:hypothetical protein
MAPRVQVLATFKISRGTVPKWQLDIINLEMILCIMLMDFPSSADFSVSVGLQVFLWFFSLDSM